MLQNYRVYRQGGDEFAILYYEDIQQFLHNLEEKCKMYNQSSNVPISYGIGYCELSNSDFIDNADKMMYKDKKRKKERQQ